MAKWKFPPPLTQVEIEWEDIYEDVVGDPSTARTAHRITTGYFLKTCYKMVGGKRRRVLTTCTTLEIDEDGERSAGNQSGWCSYPLGAVITIHWKGSESCNPDPPAVPSPSSEVN